MAETKEKKGFNAALYAVVAGVVVAVVLVLITIFAFTTRYTGFSADKVAQAYVDTIVQTGDGYNAYKNTLVSKNQKFGNFVINAYMLPYINEDAKKASFVGTGTDEEIAKTDEVYDTMYDYYVELLQKYGLDNIDAVFNDYFAKLSEVRKEVFGDEYMDTDFMFSVFESNVSNYGKSLTGTEKELGADDKTVIQEATTGKYQKMFGKDYKFTATVKESTPLSDSEKDAYVKEYKERIAPVAASGEAKAEKFGLKDTDKKHTPKSDMVGAFEKLDCSNDISAVTKCNVDVTLADGTVVASQQVYVVKIGKTWYVDNTNVDTSGLYLAK
ncbi:MAG: hypothetical protein SOY48_05950 [Eubacterium sp.]|nr:hypothetical protein [Eubacterium sp.]MDY4110410.1 hypothetical protein [Eubacterium sp.]